MPGLVAATDAQMALAPQVQGAGLCWYALCTRSRHEKRVAEQLGSREIEHFLPLYQTVHRWKDRRMRLELPLFPGYVFVRIPLEKGRCVLELPGVARFVSFCGSAAPLPAFEIEALRSGLAQSSAVPHPYLAAGRRVRVKNGPFQGMEGVVKRKDDNFRLVLSVALIQRSILLDIDGAEVEII